MNSASHFEISIDLEWVQNGAERASLLLQELRRTYDLTRFEFTDKVRVAPLEIPHSHPILTLNTRYVRGDQMDSLKFLSVYLHEQFHWGVGTLPEGCLKKVSEELKELYPDFHEDPPKGAKDEESSYLHLVINWLEFNALSQLIGIGQARRIILEFDIYTHIYQTIVADYECLQKLFRKHKIYPLYAS